MEEKPKVDENLTNIRNLFHNSRWRSLAHKVDYIFYNNYLYYGSKKSSNPYSIDKIDGKDDEYIIYFPKVKIIINSFVKTDNLHFAVFKIGDKKFELEKIQLDSETISKLSE